MAPAFLQCESHPGRPLEDHLRDVEFRLQLAEPSCKWLSWAGLFHDLGKATSYFQRYLCGEDSGRLRRHANLGAVWLLDYLTPKVAGGEFGVVDVALAFLFVRRHHGRLDDLVDALSDLQESDREELKAQLIEMDCAGAQKWLGSELGESVSAPVVDVRRTPSRVRLILELQKACSDPHAMRRFQAALRGFGRLIEADRDSAAGYEIGAFDLPPGFATEHANRVRDSLATGGAPADARIIAARDRVYAAAIAAASNGSASRGALWTLTVPTGAGKTLAAIGWALKRRECRIQAGEPRFPIIYSLPFTSIIDQNAAFIRRLWPFSTVDTSLLSVHHHLAELGDIASRAEESLARSWVEGWRADIVCTTFVQVANALFHGTCADARRFSRLAGAILILDEVQAIPANLWPVFRNSLQSLCENLGTDVLLVTATQPALFAESERIEIGPGDLPAEIAGAFDRYDLRAEVATPTRLPAIAETVARELGGGEATSCLAILNTIREALELHELLRRDPVLRGHHLFHLSTNLRPKDRRRILEAIATCSEPQVLVATQVVEAGVDLSFDVVVRAIAPLDAIIQAAGRCNRHGAGPRGRAIVLVPDGNSAHVVYGDLHIALARQILSEATSSADGGWIPEQDLVALVGKYFEQLNERIQRDTASRIHEAIRQLQFAALRGEGQDKDRMTKRVQLIEDSQDRIPHFIETDESDGQVWDEFSAARTTGDVRERRRRLCLLRSEIGQRIVEVPSRFRFGEPESDGAIVRVPVTASAEWYDIHTGWRRT